MAITVNSLKAFVGNLVDGARQGAPHVTGTQVARANIAQSVRNLPSHYMGIDDIGRGIEIMRANGAVVGSQASEGVEVIRNRFPLEGLTAIFRR